MGKKNILKVVQIVLFSLSAVLMIISLGICVYHISWMTKGSKVDATYYEDDNRIGYLTNKGFQYFELDAKYKKYVEFDSKNNKSILSIYYKAEEPTKFYCIKQIRNVFPFAGIGFVFILATLGVTIYSSKEKDNKVKEVHETDDSDEFEVISESSEPNQKE